MIKCHGNREQRIEAMKKREQLNKPDLQSELDDDLRPEYYLSDFAVPFVRGKYAKRMRETPSIVVFLPPSTPRKSTDK